MIFYITPRSQERKTTLTCEHTLVIPFILSGEHKINYRHSSRKLSAHHFLERASLDADFPLASKALVTEAPAVEE
jgi:hypothetical protein